MRRRRHRDVRAALIAAMALCALLVASGCATDIDAELIGTWEAKLVGYNSTANSVTNYVQTVAFAENGTMTLDTTLPGVTNHVTGVYEITSRETTPTLTIRWDVPVDQPTTLYFAIDDGKLITSPSPGGLSKPQNLNVTNADPVVYTRIVAP